MREVGEHVLVEVKTAVGPIPITGRIVRVETTYVISTAEDNGTVTATDADLDRWNYEQTRNVANDPEYRAKQAQSTQGTTRRSRSARDALGYDDLGGRGGLHGRNLWRTKDGDL